MLDSLLYIKLILNYNITEKRKTSQQGGFSRELILGKPWFSDEYGISVGGGLGEFKGKGWRIGLMGQSATQRHVDTLLSALKTILAGS